LSGGGRTWWAELVADSAPPPWAQARVPVNQLLQALTFHVMQGAGTLSEHFSSCSRSPWPTAPGSDRRIRLPWEVFADLMRRALRPVATRRRHREAFWRGWRLTALDGTQYSVTNTPQITATTTKAHSRRGRAAFAKISVNVLLELGLHNPLAAASGARASRNGNWRDSCWHTCPDGSCCSAIACMACRRSSSMR